MSGFDLLSGITESMTKNGTLDAIRGQLKAGILQAMSNENLPGGVKVNDLAGRFSEEKNGRLALDLVRDLLESLELRHALRALNSELGAASPRAVNRQALSKDLLIPLESPSDGLAEMPLLFSMLNDRAGALSKPKSPPGAFPKPSSPHRPPSQPSSVATTIAPIDTKSLSQRRAVMLSVTPEKPVSPSSARSLSPVSPTASSGVAVGDLSNKASRSPSSLPLENRTRVGMLNPLPPTVSLKQTSKFGEFLSSCKGSTTLNLMENGVILQSNEVQMLASFISQQSQIESINMQGCGITDEIFAALFESIRHLPKLREIDLSRNMLNTVDPQLFLMNSLSACLLSGNKLPPVLAEATMAELRMYAKQKQSVRGHQDQFPEQDPAEESDSRELSSSFEVESPEFKQASNVQKARAPLTSASRQIEVQQKAIEKAETNVTKVQLVCRSGIARSRTGWNSTLDDRESADDEFVFAEDPSQKSTDSAVAVSSANRRLNPLSNRAGRSSSARSSTFSPSGAHNNDTLEQSTGSFVEEESDTMQRSYVSNQDEGLDDSGASRGLKVAPKSKASDYADEYGDDDFEEIEEEISIGEKSSDDSPRLDDSMELSPTPKKDASKSTSALSRTKSGFIETVRGNAGKKIEARARHSDDEADQEAQEESSPPMSKIKAMQSSAGDSKKLSAFFPAPATGWAKSANSAPAPRGLVTPKGTSSGKSRSSTDAVVADLEESVASEEIDALEFSMGGGESDSNGSFSFLNEESVASHKAKVPLKSARLNVNRHATTSAVSQSTESADLDFSVTETDLSASGHGAFETEYDYTTSALPPVKAKGARLGGGDGPRGW